MVIKSKYTIIQILIGRLSYSLNKGGY